MVAVCCSVQSILQKKYCAKVEKKNGTHMHRKNKTNRIETWTETPPGIMAERFHWKQNHHMLARAQSIGKRWERDLKGLYISRQVSFDMETCKTSGQNRQDAFKSITSTQIADQIDLNVYSMSVWCCHSWSKVTMRCWYRDVSKKRSQHACFNFNCRKTKNVCQELCRRFFSYFFFLFSFLFVKLKYNTNDFRHDCIM